MARSREESLRQLLARVHERLDGAPTVDPETRKLLVTITRDIERALASPSDRAVSGSLESAHAARGGAAASRKSEASVSSLEGLAARFDADHPALAQTLRQLVEFLGKAGI